MRINGHSRSIRIRNSFQPRVEPLEDRLCFSVTATTIALAGGGNELNLVGDNGTNAITVTDHGNGSVDVTGAASASANNIRRIVFDGKNGSDTVDYLLDNLLTNSESLRVILGSGGAGTAAVDLSQGVSGVKLSVSVMGSAQDDTISVILGAVSAAARVGITINGGDGTNDIAVASATASNISANSSLNVQISGGAGADTVDTVFAGQVLGTFDYNASGGSGSSDVLGDTFTFDAGSTGKARLKYSGFESVNLFGIQDQSGGGLQITINQETDRRDHVRQEHRRCGEWHHGATVARNHWGGSRSKHVEEMLGPWHTSPERRSIAVWPLRCWRSL